MNKETAVCCAHAFGWRRFTRFLVCLCAVAVLVTSLGGCEAGKSGADASQIWEAGFSADAEGVLYGQELRVRIAFSLHGDSGTVSVEYFSPPSVQGLTVTAQISVADRRDTAVHTALIRADAPSGLSSNEPLSALIGFPTVTDAQLTYNGHSHVLPRGASDGLLLPVTVFLGLGVPSEVQRGGEGYTLLYDHDRVLVLSSASVPLSLSSPALSLHLTRWAWG